MPDITVVIPSYNRGEYISEALDSVLMQKTDYDYKIIIADDCSSDNTSEIVENYIKKYPDKITFLKADKNQKLYKNVLRAYEITKTDYFCVLDADDFWIDEHKIQKALDFLEKHKDFTIYATNTLIQDKEGKRSHFNKSPQKDSTFEDYLDGKAALGCTLGGVFRNVIFKNGIPEKMQNLADPIYEQTFRGDSFRNLLHLHEGKAHLEPDYDGVYRTTPDGLWRSKPLLKRKIFNCHLYLSFYEYFDKKYPQLFKKAYEIFDEVNSDLSEYTIEQTQIEKELKELNLKFTKISDENKKFNLLSLKKSKRKQNAKNLAETKIIFKFDDLGAVGKNVCQLDKILKRKK